MSEESEMWGEIRKDSQERRSRNREYSTNLIMQKAKEHGWVVENFNDVHFRINTRFDFWPGTGKYLDRVMGKYRRGVFNLIRELESIFNKE
jgi:hypothetical protein